jgi:hypothetical protein
VGVHTLHTLHTAGEAHTAFVVRPEAEVEVVAEAVAVLADVADDEDASAVEAGNNETACAREYRTPESVAVGGVEVETEARETVPSLLSRYLQLRHHTDIPHIPTFASVITNFHQRWAYAREHYEAYCATWHGWPEWHVLA